MKTDTLQIPHIDFFDPIATKIIMLENLREKTVAASTPPAAFSQLHSLFRITESLASARIEGNHTTIADYVQDKIEGKEDSQPHKEIANIEECINLINDEFKNNEGFQISEFFIKQLHGILTKGLTNEGSQTPGAYRSHQVKITGSQHKPPEFLNVPEMMTELLAFINKKDPPQADLLKVAVAHHRFVWIHPFDNGNGRMARLLTYIMLRQYGFIKVYFLNPAAVFCQSREGYINGLEKADTGTQENIKEWCLYVLDGLLRESKKIKQLMSKDFLDSKIILPAMHYALNNNLITADENLILKCSVEKNDYTIMVKDLKEVFPHKTDAQLTYMVKQMLAKHLLRKDAEKSRKYTINLNAHALTRGMLESLINENLVEFK